MQVGEAAHAKTLRQAGASETGEDQVADVKKDRGRVEVAEAREATGG